MVAPGVEVNLGTTKIVEKFTDEFVTHDGGNPARAKFTLPVSLILDVGDLHEQGTDTGGVMAVQIGEQVDPSTGGKGAVEHDPPPMLTTKSGKISNVRHVTHPFPKGTPPSFWFYSICISGDV